MPNSAFVAAVMTRSPSSGVTKLPAIHQLVSLDSAGLTETCQPFKGFAGRATWMMSFAWGGGSRTWF